MKIGYFTETYLPQTNGVVESINNFGEELVKRGHEVHIFAPNPGIKEYKGMQIHSVPSIKFKPYPDYKIAIPLKVKIPKLDIVHTHGPFSMGVYGLYTAKKQKIPAVSTYHTLLSEYVSYLSKYGERITKKIAEEYCEYHYRRYDSLITPSNYMKKNLSKKLQAKTTTIPSPIKNNLKPVPNAKQKLKLQKYKKIYLNLGRISPEKDIDTLLKAAPYFIKKNEILLIAGKGPVLNELKKQAKQLKLKNKIKFLGYIPEETKTTYYTAADLFITASKSETEGLVAIEAQACGTPVIAPEITAMPELITEGENGYLFTPDNYKELARIINYHKFPKTMKNKAIKKAKQYSIKNSTDKLEKLYEKTIKEKKHKTKWRIFK